MSFHVPEFPLAVNIYTTNEDATTELRVTTVGNLAPGRRVIGFTTSAAGMAEYSTVNTILLLPARTDIRDGRNGSAGDLVEVPVGTGSWYRVYGVMDVGRGFPNEYRRAWLVPEPHMWPEPYL